MKVYIDSEFKCYIENPDSTYLEAETDFFDGKCKIFIEGYRFIPFGKSWTRSDNITFHGEIIAPWKDFRELDAAQREYERQRSNEYNLILQELGVET